MKVLKLNVCIMLFLFMTILNGCSGTSSSGDSGALSLSLTDASSDQYDAVYVTIDEIKVHHKGGDKWITVVSPKTTYNLLDLVNGRMETLGDVELDPGVYTQMRLYLGDTHDNNKNLIGVPHPYANYVIDEDDVHELKVPSGYQTGVKLVHKFEIVADLTVDLVLDFDACASVVKAGKNGKYLLKPTIKITDAVNNAIVNGIVLGAQQTGLEDDAVGLEGATVSAQTHKETSDAKDQVSVYTATITTGSDKDDTAGSYLMYLPPGTYTIVAYKPGFKPEHRTITTALDDVWTVDFELSPAVSSENVSGIVTLDASSKSAVEDGQSVLISFRQQLEGIDKVIEVVSLNLNLEEGTNDYEVSLPEGKYLVVASTAGMETFKSPVTIEEGIPVTLNIDFPITPKMSPIPI